MFCCRFVIIAAAGVFVIVVVVFVVAASVACTHIALAKLTTLRDEFSRHQKLAQ